MYSDVLKHLETADQRDQLILGIKKVLSNLDQPNQSPENLIGQYLPASVSKSVNVDQFNLNPKKFLNDLATVVDAIPVLSMVIAIDPSQHLIQSVREWWLKNFNNQVLLDVEIDSEIIAGAQISFGGKFVDLSFRSKLKEWKINTHAQQS